MARTLTFCDWGILLFSFFLILPLGAQESLDTLPSGVKFTVHNPNERLDMIVNTSRIVEFPQDVPKMLVNNPELVTVTPLTPRTVQISGKKTGVTQLNVWAKDGSISSLDITVLGDVRELDQVLKAEFPEAALRLRPLASSLYISGFVPKAEMVSQIKRVAEDFFPKIIDNMSVGGVQKVLLHVKVVEVSRTKLRTQGFDWALLNGNDFVFQGASNIVIPKPDSIAGLLSSGTNNVRFGVVNNGNAVYGFLEALKQNDLAKLLAEPTLTTMSGRPASFNVGGEVPIPMASGLGTTTVQYKEFGTQIDFVPIVLGNGSVRLEVRPVVTEIDSSLRDSTTGVPGFRTRRADVGVEMKAGQTLAIAGLVYNRTEAQVRGVPWLSDLPWAGAAFRRVHDRQNEVELVIMVRPEFAAAMDPHEVPACGPGQLTTSPSDVELYGRGYLEVPKCCKEGNCNRSPGRHWGYSEGSESMGYANQGARNQIRSQAQNYSAYGNQQGSQTQGSRSYNPQNATARTPGMRPSSAAKPSLIGPLGYDNLR